MSAADEWRAAVMKDRRRFRKGTAAHHKLGDISRDEEDWFYYTAKDRKNYYGHWLTGFGFINVAFPVDTTRAATDAEIKWLAGHPVVLS